MSMSQNECYIYGIKYEHWQELSMTILNMSALQFQKILE